MAYQMAPKAKQLSPYDPIEGNYRVRLDANESFLLPTEEDREKLARAAAETALNRYPDPLARDLCAAFARGNLGKAIHLASSEEFKELYRRVMSLLKNVGSMDIGMLLDCIREIKEQNFDIYEVLDLMQLWYRDVLMYKVTKDMNLLVFKDEYRMINETGQKIDYAGLEAILAAIDTARTRLEANVNLDLAMELLLLTMKNPS